MRKRLNHEPQTDGRPAPVGIQDKAAIACHGSLVGLDINLVLAVHKNKKSANIQLEVF